MLNSVEQLEVEALAELMIPSDSNGPGAKEAGAIYFIDQMLAGVYGFNAKNYMQGPFVQPNISTPVTVKGVEWSVASPGSPATASLPTCITYSAGTLKQSLGCGFYYQHPFQLREFWETGLANLETYCNSAYGGNFETLSTTLQAQAVTDCWNNTPTNFTSPTPAEFISEVQEMVWAGFITDPIHGGNKNMVGWTYVGHNGVNEGNFFGCGYTTKQLMVMCTPVRLKPASIGQLEAVLGQNVS